jgi:hypothetical protein
LPLRLTFVTGILIIIKIIPRFRSTSIFKIIMAFNILGLPYHFFVVESPQPRGLFLAAGELQTSKLVKIIMKTIAILALTAAAFVSCQQQQQQQQVPTEPVAPAPVVPVKK